MSEKFFKLTNAIWCAALKELKTPDIKILFYLLTLSPLGDKNFQIRTADIAEATGLHRTTVTRSLRRLTDKGCIDLEIGIAWVRIKPKGRAIAGEIEQESSEVVVQSVPHGIIDATRHQVCHTASSVPHGTLGCQRAHSEDGKNQPEPVSEPLRLIDLNRSNRSLKEREGDEKSAEFSTEFREWLTRKAESLPRKPAFLDQWIVSQSKKPSVVNEFQDWLASQKSSAAAAPPDDRQFESQADYWRFVNERSN